MLGLFRKKLPGCDPLFVKFLSPWYPDDDKPDMTRPDLYQIAGFEGEPLNFDKIQYLPASTLQQTKTMITQTMVAAALDDFQYIYKTEKIDLYLLDAIDKHFNRRKIAALIKESDPTDFSNPYLVAVCEFGVLLGELFRQLDGFDWLYSHPYYHSIIVHKETGFGITVFDWAVKKFSEYGVDDGFVAKFHAAIKTIREAA